MRPSVACALLSPWSGVSIAAAGCVAETIFISREQIV